MRSQRQSEVEHEQGEDGKDDKYCIHLLSFTFFIRELKGCNYSANHPWWWILRNKLQ